MEVRARNRDKSGDERIGPVLLCDIHLNRLELAPGLANFWWLRICVNTVEDAEAAAVDYAQIYAD